MFRIILIVTLILFSNISLAETRAKDKKNCVIPVNVLEVIQQKYKDFRIVEQKDLFKSDRQFFRKDHGDACPGFVEVNFFGNGKPTYAVLLYKKNKGKIFSKLIVMSQKDNPEKWVFSELETHIDQIAVIWKEPPGKYEGVTEDKKIIAKYPVIILVGYESWGIAYAWTGKIIDKVWVSD